MVRSAFPCSSVCGGENSHHLLHDRLLALLMGELIEITLTSAAVQLQGEGRHRPTLAHFDPKRSFEAFTRLAYQLDLPISLSHRLGDGTVVSFLYCMNDPNRRVTWQATSNDENS